MSIFIVMHRARGAADRTFLGNFLNTVTVNDKKWFQHSVTAEMKWLHADCSRSISYTNDSLRPYY